MENLETELNHLQKSMQKITGELTTGLLKNLSLNNVDITFSEVVGKDIIRYTWEYDPFFSYPRYNNGLVGIYVQFGTDGSKQYLMQSSKGGGANLEIISELLQGYFSLFNKETLLMDGYNGRLKLRI